MPRKKVESEDVEVDAVVEEVDVKNTVRFLLKQDYRWNTAQFAGLGLNKAVPIELNSDDERVQELRNSEFVEEVQ